MFQHPQIRLQTLAKTLIGYLTRPPQSFFLVQFLKHPSFRLCSESCVVGQNNIAKKINALTIFFD